MKTTPKLSETAAGASSNKLRDARNQHMLEQQKALMVPAVPLVPTDVSKVKSLKIEGWENSQISGGWGELKRKMRDRDKQLKGAKIYVNSKMPDEQKQAFERLEKRWPTLRAYLNGSKPFDPTKDSIASETEIQNTVKGDLDDIATLSSNSSLGMTLAVVREFLASLEKYTGRKKTLDEERIQFHRFDDLFQTDSVKALLSNLNPPGLLTPSDIKALAAQESGDFTIGSIAGIDSNKPGIPSGEVNKISNVVGITQVRPLAKVEALAWAKTAGVNIPDKVKGKDSREIPSESIKIGIAYLGHTLDMLNKLGERMPKSPLEKKKLLFARYNAGGVRFKAARKQFDQKYGTEQPYTFEKLKPYLEDETHDYVANILKRL